MAADNKPKIALGCSSVLVFLSLLVVGGAALAPSLTNGRASWDESMPVIGAGGGCCFFSGLLLVGAIIWLVSSGKKNA
jgi:hypothetical protein